MSGVIEEFPNEELPNDFGRRLREVRDWREMTQEVVAQLAGFANGSVISKLENGHAGVPNRNTLESLAMALRVSPEELVRYRPWERNANPATHAGAVAFETALDAYDLGQDPDLPIREWGEIQKDIAQLINLQHVEADYTEQGKLGPKLMGELHAVYARQPEHRTGALLGLIACYSSAVWVTKRLGSRGSSLLAAKEAQNCSKELAMPQWQGYTTWLRGDAGGSISKQARAEQRKRAVQAVDSLSPAMDDPEVLQACGMLHLSAALASAALKQRDEAETHIGEATALATRLDQEVGGFAHLWFGTANVGIWRTTISVEFGDGPKVAELARTVNVNAIPSDSRRAEFYAEVGRQCLTEKGTREKGVELISYAEELAPERIRNDMLIQQALAEGIRAFNRDDPKGREIRGLAYRCGVAPNG